MRTLKDRFHDKMGDVMGLRCRSCDSPSAKWVESWEDYYCQECLDAIYDSLDEFEDFEEISELGEMFWDD